MAYIIISTTAGLLRLRNAIKLAKEENKFCKKRKSVVAIKRRYGEDQGLNILLLPHLVFLQVQGDLCQLHLSHLSMPDKQRVSKSHEILMFVSKEMSNNADITKHNCTIRTIYGF